MIVRKTNDRTRDTNLGPANGSASTSVSFRPDLPWREVEPPVKAKPGRGK